MGTAGIVSAVWANCWPNMLDPLSGNNQIVWRRQMAGPTTPTAGINAFQSHIWGIDPNQYDKSFRYVEDQKLQFEHWILSHFYSGHKLFPAVDIF